jgi:hypothetical protein
MIWFFLLFCALALLALPSPRAALASCSYRSLQAIDIHRRNAAWGGIAVAALRVPALWFDLARGLVGAVYLVWATAPERMPPAFDGAAQPLVQGGLVVVGATISMLLTMARFHHPEEAPAPVAFISGLLIGLCPLPLLAVAWIAAVLVVIALKSLHAFFCTLSGALLVLGALLDRELAFVFTDAVLALTPTTAAAIRGRQLTLPFRRWREF